MGPEATLRPIPAFTAGAKSCTEVLPLGRDRAAAGFTTAGLPAAGFSTAGLVAAGFVAAGFSTAGGGGAGAGEDTGTGTTRAGGPLTSTVSSASKNASGRRSTTACLRSNSSRVQLIVEWAPPQSESRSSSGSRGAFTADRGDEGREPGDESREPGDD